MAAGSDDEKCFRRDEGKALGRNGLSRATLNDTVHAYESKRKRVVGVTILLSKSSNDSGLK